MGEGYLIDNNVLIDYLNGKLSPAGSELLKKVVNEIPTLSFITKIEVLSFRNEEAAEKPLPRFY